MLETMPLRHVAEVRVSNVDKKSVEGEAAVRLCNYTDVYYSNEIRDDRDFMAATATKSQIERFRLAVGDTIVTKDSETADDIAVPAYVAETADDLVCGYHLAMLRPRVERVEPRFLAWAIRSDFCKEQFSVSATGVTRYGLKYEAMLGVSVPTPLLDVQRKIADFLDDQVSRIDEAVRLRREQLDLLNARLESALEALLVTPFPDSEPLARLTDPSRPIQYGIVLPGPDTEGGVPIIKGGDVASHRLRLDLLKRTTHEIDAQYSRSRVKAGDLVIAIRGSVGEIGRVPDELTGANLTQDSARIAPLGCDADWLYAVLETPTVQSRMREMITGATVKGINIGDLRRIEVPTPASLHIQRELGREASRLRSETNEVRSLCRESNSLLEERKRSLITAAVTGEFDVTTASGRGV
ncbi:hypothetical protein IEQ44_11530 [Nocardioides sp. Y6]|uniref:Restriction endonuclease subunit S n=1 Tax=Nocardioides malaquae TaxID=2773426 RepID=A0ABR9RUM9_9ACTN|nr:hypothetical protein [Nocardioides malaquae]MBE7325285.1 hypothetical protein [Nocardioides malaquae]